MALNYQQLLVAVPLVIRGGNVPNLVGEAGIGKSALVRDVARRHHARLFTTVVSLAEKGDLAIPVPPLTSDSFIQTKHYGKLADVKFGYSHTLIAIIESAERHPQQPIYWFLDEFNRGSHAVQCELMNLVLQREVNGLKLPPQVHMLIAENPDPSMSGFSQTNYTVFGGDAAIKDRTVRLVMQADLGSWLKWARRFDSVRHRQMIHPRVVSYLENHPRMLHDPQLSHDLYPTPRAWQRVSDNLYELDQLPPGSRYAIQLDLFSGDLGAAAANAFNRFLLKRPTVITSADFVSWPVERLKKTFAKFDEAQKQHVLLLVIKHITKVSDRAGRRLADLLMMLSVDGRYSLALIVANDTDFLDRIFREVQDHPQSRGLTRLYLVFEKIGFGELQ